MTSTTSPPARRRYAPRMPLEQRREQLLDATIGIIVRDGYDRVTIDAIARECGVTRPVVYSAYDGLGPLLNALLDRSQARAVTAIADIFAETPDNLVRVGTRRLIETVRADPDIWRPILGLTENVPRAVRDRVESDREWIRGQIATLLAGLADPDVTAHLVVAALEHAARLALDSDYGTERLVDAVDGLIGGLLR